MPHEGIPVSKTKTTIEHNNQYWDDVIMLKGDEIQSIDVIAFFCSIYQQQVSYQLVQNYRI